jgi:hypothetical protein
MRFVIFLFAVVTSSSQPATKPASVEGQAINSITKAPVARATVTLRNTAKNSAYAIISDDSGRFKFPNVEPATGYIVTAEAPGYTPDSTHPAKLFNLAEDQKVTGITASLLPGGAISGKVVDADGDPITGAQVQLRWYGYQSGTKQLEEGESRVTDDRSEYRLPLLAPGRYYLLARAPGREPDPPGRMHRNQPDFGFADTFYPNTREISGATPVDLSPGAEIGGIDFRLQEIRLFHIRGKISRSLSGLQIMRTGVVAARCEAGGAGVPAGPFSNAAVSMDGSFD